LTEVFAVLKFSVESNLQPRELLVANLEMNCELGDVDSIIQTVKCLHNMTTKASASCLRFVPENILRISSAPFNDEQR